MGTPGTPPGGGEDGWGDSPSPTHWVGLGWVRRATARGALHAQGAIALHDISRTRHVGERAAHYYPPTRGRLQLVHLRRNASMDVSVFTPEKLSNKFSPLPRAEQAVLFHK